MGRRELPHVAKSRKQYYTMGAYKEIVINRMYNGDYLYQNLGHEIINMYKSDNGRNYLYLQYDGTFADIHCGKVEAMLLVRTVSGEHMVEVIGKAEGLTEVYRPGQKEMDQKAFIRGNGIKYAGVWLDEIFEDNTYQQNIFITYEAKIVKKAAKRFYISYGESRFTHHVLTENKQAKASLKQYISTDTAADFSVLRSVINDESLWGEETKGVALTETVKPTHRTTYFDICGINNYELAWSNALSFFMEKYPPLVVKFGREVLQVANPINSQFAVSREEHNVDLLIRDGETTIVVENKIKSDINGINNAGYDSQLAKYFEYAKQDQCNVRAYVLTPDYNDVNLSCYTHGDKYRKIYYSQVRDFLAYQPEYRTDAYLRDMVDAMNQHSTVYCDDLYEEMLSRFRNCIKSRIAKL